ncbi:MAG: cytochrome b/b6 domain-containing protein [Myxococcota bacterium]
MVELRLERRKVYDGLLRAVHAVIGLSVVGLGATALFAETLEKGPARRAVWEAHALTGYVLAAALVVRVIWGLVGPRSARWSDLWHPRAWLQILRGRWPRSEGFGHDVAASGAYLVVYALLALMVLSGLALAGLELGMGPLAAWLFDRVWLEELFEEPHEVGALLIAAFTVLHVGALIWHEWRERRPVAQAMVSGYQYRVISRER